MKGALAPVLAVLLLAAGCAQPPARVPAQPAPPQAGGGQCNAAPAQWAVGRPYTPELAEDVRRTSGARTARVLRPGQVVTMEFNSERVNLRLDARDRVEAVTCG